MLYSDIDFTDLKNPHLTEVNGVRMDKRFLRENVQGTLGHWLRDNLQLARYCPDCYTIERSPGRYKAHFNRRVHIQAMDPNKKPLHRFY